jgi:hypothetical protein
MSVHVTPRVLAVPFRAVTQALTTANPIITVAPKAMTTTSAQVGGPVSVTTSQYPRGRSPCLAGSEDVQSFSSAAVQKHA